MRHKRQQGESHSDFQARVALDKRNAVRRREDRKLFPKKKHLGFTWGQVKEAIEGTQSQKQYDVLKVLPIPDPRFTGTWLGMINYMVEKGEVFRELDDDGNKLLFLRYEEEE